MSDDLKFNNIPSTELNNLQRAIPPSGAVNSENAETDQATPNEEKNMAQNIEPTNEENNVGVQNSQSTVNQFEQNTNAANYSKQYKFRQNTYQFQPNSNAYNNAVQNNTQLGGYQSSPNTNNIYPQRNTQQNNYRYPPNNNVNNFNSQANTRQNSYQYPPNAATNNSYAQFNNPNGAYQYPPNIYMNNAYAQNNSYYPNQGYQPAPNGYRPYYYEPSPKELEKLALSKDCSTAGKTTLTIYIVMFIVAIIIVTVATMCGVVRNVPDLEKDPYAGFTPMGFYLYEGLSSLLSIFIPTLIIIKASKRKMSELIPFKKIGGKKLFSIVMCGMSLCMVAQLMATLIGINFSLFGIDIYKGLESETATGAFDLLMSSICTALIPALVEEFAFRGLVVGILKRYDDMLAVFASAFLFGMLHGNLGQIPFAFVVGLILGYVRVKTDSMLPGILIHFGNNFYAVIVTILEEIAPEQYVGVIDASFILVLITIGFIATSYLAKNEKDMFKIEKKESYLTYREKLNVFMKTGTVIASIILLSISSIAVLFLV